MAKSENARMAVIAAICLLFTLTVWNVLHQTSQEDDSLPITLMNPVLPHAELLLPSQNDPPPTEFDSKNTPDSEVKTVVEPKSAQAPKKLAMNVVSISGKVVSQVNQWPVNKFSLLLVQGQYITDLDKNYRDYYPPTGEFTIKDISSNQPLFLHIRAPGYADHVVNSEDLRNDALRSDIVIALRPDYILTGQVVDTRGSPVAGVRILNEKLQPKKQNLEFSTVAITDTLGAFTIGGLQNRQYALNTYHEKYFAIELAVFPGQQSGPIHIIIDSFGSVEGYVTLDGVPLRGVTIRCNIFDESPTANQNEYFFQSSHTDIDGYFYIANVPEGVGILYAHRLHIDDSRRMKIDIEVSPDRTTQVDFPFPPATASVEGYVIAEDSKEKSVRVFLRYLYNGNSRSRIVQTQEDGYYLFEDVVPGIVAVVAGNEKKFVIAETIEDHRTRVDVDLNHGATIRVTISNLPPSPHTYARFILEDQHLPTYPNRSELGYIEIESIDRWPIKNGEVVIDNVENGTYTIVLISNSLTDEGKFDDYAFRAVTTTVTVAGGVDLNLDLAF